MSIVKPEEFELRQRIFQGRFDPGMRAFREWLFMSQSKINANWYQLVGVELLQAQGFAKSLADAIKIIDVEPINKEVRNG